MHDRSPWEASSRRDHAVVRRAKGRVGRFLKDRESAVAAETECRAHLQLGRSHGRQSSVPFISPLRMARHIVGSLMVQTAVCRAEHLLHRGRPGVAGGSGRAVLAVGRAVAVPPAHAVHAHQVQDARRTFHHLPRDPRQPAPHLCVFSPVLVQRRMLMCGNKRTAC